MALEDLATNGSPGRKAEIEDTFRVQRGRLWGLAYRLTGSADDADDVVQEAFERLLGRPPDDAPTDPAAWLARVATNLGIDALRRRKRRRYTGPWLPSPVEASDADWLEGLADGADDPEARYGRLESATHAFLLALEALGPRQRAALLLRDVLGCSALETAERMGASEGAVRVLHLRARRALEKYDRSRCIPTAAERARHRKALETFLTCLVAQDVAGIEALLSESVRTETDAAGEYTALPTSMTGRARVARFYLAAALHRQTGEPRISIRLVNGMPAAFITLGRPVRRQAPVTLLRCELDADDRICAIYGVLAPSKLRALRTS